VIILRSPYTDLLFDELVSSPSQEGEAGELNYDFFGDGNPSQHTNLLSAKGEIRESGETPAEQQR
jgi:hypothetical protein